MNCHWTKTVVTLILAAGAGRAQVLAPEEIHDPLVRSLQQKYRNELKSIATAAAAHNFPYHFYFSRQLDLEEKDQQAGDQRSIQFDRYQGRIVLKITGNYFASYSADLLKKEDRARMTYESVILPLLQAAFRSLEKADTPQAFAFEISHHVRRKVLGVSTEKPENVVLVIPKASAQRLFATTDPQARIAAVSEGETFLNAAPISFWPRPEQAEVAEDQAAPREPVKSAAAPAPVAMPAPTVSPSLMRGAGLPNLAGKVAPPTAETLPPASDPAPDAGKDLQQSYQAALERMVHELGAQAHFVPYAPPAFIPFHNGLYLQLSVSSALPESSAGSQYRLAAFAFDQHIAHLVRPVLGYLKDAGDFDGIDFSTSVRLGSDANGAGSSLAVEFIFPLKLLRSYADFDSTGQQLIDAGYVLINGERVSLNLQDAEAAAAAAR